MPAVSTSTLVTLAAVLMIGVGVIGFGSVLVRSAAARFKRRERLSGEPGSGPRAATGPFAQLADRVRRLGGQVETQDPSQASALRTKLARAGFSSREAVAYYLGARSILLVIATVATLLLVPMALTRTGGVGVVLIAALFASVAVFGPDQVLRSRRTSREREYRDGFPDLLDLLVASVQAGLSLDAAVSRITEELVTRYPNLAEQLYLMTLEFRAGQARKDAWSRLADRLGIDEARSFATMLRQAEEMGTSMGETLSVFSDDMRQKRMLRAEEKALALPAKMMIPLILFIFPCLIGVLMLPAGVKISHAFH
ncbi:MAG: type II secretion system F family protein [Caulobacteraceae bacterium]|nr:type II secretion system F family protein [Caulobacteraceae bacterium]